MILSLIVPTKNRREDLVETVQSIIAQTHLPDELIVIDQSATSETGETLRLMMREAPAVRFIYVWDAGITGLPMARNRGFDSSHGDLICYLDDDTTPAPGYLAEVERGFSEFPNWDGLSGRLTESELPSRLRKLAASAFRVGMFRDDRASLATLETPSERRLISGAACCFRRRALERYRFDETLIGYALGEDFEFCLRAGREFHFGAYPAAQVRHRRSVMGRPAAAELRKMARGSAGYLWRKHRRHLGDDLCYIWLRLGFILERILLAFSGP